jgi:dyslexia susceptibility 1 candidate gene 1 protein
MPISPTYEWEETDVALEVRVVLPGATKARADVSATDCMIKVNSAPYLLLLDLAGEVDDAQSSATLTADGVRFKLPKVGVFWALAGRNTFLACRPRPSCNRSPKPEPYYHCRGCRDCGVGLRRLETR